MRTENKIWTIMTIYALSIFAIAIMLTSCGSSKSCHNNGHYVAKDVKRAQSKPRHY